MAGRPRHLSSISWFEEAEAIAPGPKGPEAVDANELERLKAQGHPARTVANINIEFNRDDLAHLLHFLEERALKADTFYEVRQMVMFVEMIRNQARKKGF